MIPLKYVRLFVDDAGLSHFEECTLPLATHNFAPPTTPLEVSEFIPAAGFAVVRFAASQAVIVSEPDNMKNHCR